MIKNITQLEVVVNEKTVRILADMDTDINVVREALNRFQKFVDQIEADAKERLEKKNTEAPVEIEAS